MYEQINIKIANRYFQKAFDSQMQGNIADAKNNYMASIELHPTAEAHVNLGWAYSKDENYPEAITQCHKALSIDPQYGMAYSDIGYYLLKLSSIDEAICWFEVAIEQNEYEGKYYTYYNLGKAYEKKGKWKKAVEMYGESLKQKPGFKLANNKLMLLTANFN
jgi:tetratricopeptide (TPR) repeat protein